MLQVQSSDRFEVEPILDINANIGYYPSSVSIKLVFEASGLESIEEKSTQEVLLSTQQKPHSALNSISFCLLFVLIVQDHSFVRLSIQ